MPTHSNGLPFIAGMVLGEDKPRYVALSDTESHELLRAVMEETHTEFVINSWVPNPEDKIYTDLDLLKELFSFKNPPTEWTEEEKHLRRKIEEKLRKEVSPKAQKKLAWLLNMK